MSRQYGIQPANRNTPVVNQTSPEESFNAMHPTHLDDYTSLSRPLPSHHSDMAPSPPRHEYTPYQAYPGSQDHISVSSAADRTGPSPMDPFASHNEIPTPSNGRLTPGQQRFSGYFDHAMGRGSAPLHADAYNDFDPRDIADDGDDDGMPHTPQRRQSRLLKPFGAGAGAGAGAVVMHALGSRDAVDGYGPVAGGGGGGSGNKMEAEKSEWLQRQSSGNKRLRWIVGTIVALVIIGAAVGIAVAVLMNSGSSSSAPNVDDIDGLLDIQSSLVQQVMDDKNLHRVFYTLDYSPLNTQYPDCLTNPPIQNNVTLDVAIMSQLTPAIRLYGTDCNQTEMVLEAITRLEMEDSLKVWLGVYLDGNSTTNARQLRQMWEILDTYDASHFVGVIVGNEVLYSEYLTATELADIISEVRTNFTTQGIDLPVANAELGDDWTTALAAASDIVMANIHPFFAGVTPSAAASWTWTFWNTHNNGLATASTGPYPASVIAETGWPSQGGNNCGTGKLCVPSTKGAVASVDNMNVFMESWVCPALANGTAYFWFEAFDEPWKHTFDDPDTGNFWEPYWGLFDVDRNLKDGLKIPDCDGDTIEKLW